MTLEKQKSFEDSPLWKLKVRLQFSGWLQYIIHAIWVLFCESRADVTSALTICVSLIAASKLTVVSPAGKTSTDPMIPVSNRSVDNTGVAFLIDFTIDPYPK
jgi:hypothetical protein